jgi:hypothetical protein
MTSEVRHKRGDVREDGMVFWARNKEAKNGEYWVPRSRFEDMLASEQARDKHLKEKQVRGNRKRGDVSSEGLLFWAYSKSCKNGEQWISLGKFRELKTKACRASNAHYHKRDKIAFNAAQRERYKNDPLCAMEKRLRGRVYSAFKAKGLRKSSKTEKLLGCTYAEFRAHVEAQFLPGMTWENRHLWHIDHYVPCDAADTSEDMERLFHFTNLHPLWGPENQSKSAKIPEEHELPADLHDEVRKIWQRAKDSACTK